MSHVTVKQALEVAGALLGRAPDRIAPFRPPVGGDDSWAFRLRADGDAALLKIKKRAGTPVGVYFHQRVKEAGVPVPELLAFGPDAGPNGQACAVWEWIDGAPAHWSAGEACPYDEAEFGEMLRRVHELRFDGPFGMLGDDPPATHFRSHPDLGPASETWAGFFHFEDAARRYFANGMLTRPEADLLASLPERLPAELCRAPKRLLHMGDVMHHGNMILEPRTGRILAVVDYVESMAGDPRWELACVDYYFGQYPFERREFDMESFHAAYGTAHDPDDPVGRVYLLAILVFEKLLFFDRATPRGQWAVDTVKRIPASWGDGG